jgi:hypothetical protein
MEYLQKRVSDNGRKIYEVRHHSEPAGSLKGALGTHLMLFQRNVKKGI